ncbi:phosphoribosylglycinamide formyltransferase [Bacillus daqingensis]|uniref:Phosphoribosylglycinamide formyltransferase n=1 Tax=Bacillus daqingensis TaxID=872396 RepID=A0ABV9NXM8_9BACI
MMRIAVFASGSGSNFQAVLEACVLGRIKGEVCQAVCDKPGAYVETRAERAGVPLFSFSPSDYESKQAFETELVALLKEREVDVIVLAGYMRLIGPVLLGAFEGRIMNIHPSLLPSFPGLRAVEQAVDAGVKVTGVTVHLVDEGMDTGPILAQKPVTIEPEDTYETTAAKIHRIEHSLYPETIEAWRKTAEERESTWQNEHS